VILWDITVAEEQVEKRQKATMKASKKDKEEESKRKAPVVIFSRLSCISRSHTAVVSDLQWLPADAQVSLMFFFKMFVDNAKHKVVYL
jgi:hypothetical protein